MAAPLAGDIVEKYVFHDTSSLAFEVDLKLTDDKFLAVSDTWRQKFHTSDLWLQFRAKEDLHIFRHLFLDFHSTHHYNQLIRLSSHTWTDATYVPELSTVTGFGKGRESLTRLATLVDFTKDYLGRLANSGYHVLYSVPLWTQRGTDLSHAYTDVKHQVVTKSSITVSNAGIFSPR